eukprot:scaffold122761_cov45-Prasinocladus_malaysianus.AAC.1
MSCTFVGYENHLTCMFLSDIGDSRLGSTPSGHPGSLGGGLPSLLGSQATDGGGGCGGGAGGATNPRRSSLGEAGGSPVAEYLLFRSVGLRRPPVKATRGNDWDLLGCGLCDVSGLGIV